MQTPVDVIHIPWAKHAPLTFILARLESLTDVPAVPTRLGRDEAECVTHVALNLWDAGGRGDAGWGKVGRGGVGWGEMGTGETRRGGRAAGE